jgi:hypothetical protein
VAADGRGGRSGFVADGVARQRWAATGWGFAGASLKAVGFPYRESLAKGPAKESDLRFIGNDGGPVYRVVARDGSASPGDVLKLQSSAPAKGLPT